LDTEALARKTEKLNTIRRITISLQAFKRISKLLTIGFDSVDWFMYQGIDFHMPRFRMAGFLRWMRFDSGFNGRRLPIHLEGDEMIFLTPPAASPALR